MIIIAVKTDSPRTYLGLFDDYKPLAHKTWEAQRTLASTIYKEISNLLVSNNLTIKDIDGLIGYSGPGSFTGLRIGLTALNTIAYADKAHIVETTGHDWLERGIDELLAGKNAGVILPEYGAEANITAPRK